MRILKTGNCDDSIHHQASNCGIDTKKKYLVPVTERGFTLLEIIIVIFLISIMLTLAFPSFSTVGESKLKSDAKKIASILRYLNDSSVSTKESFSLRVELREKLIYYTGPDGEKKERFDSISAVELQSKGIVTEGELIIIFGPSGASEAVRFLLSRNEKAMTVDFNPVSGRVKIIRDEELKIRGS